MNIKDQVGYFVKRALFLRGRVNYYRGETFPPLREMVQEFRGKRDGLMEAARIVKGVFTGARERNLIARYAARQGSV